jgi:S-DNA-T family DNA segregation ATPase FtsK/SpoIIIE
VKYLVNAYRDELIGGELNLTPEAVGGENSDVLGSALESDDLGEDDEMYEQAKEEVIKAGKASTSYIQRKLRLGYARAARIMDMLEQRGVISPGDGAKPRDVLVGSGSEAEENKQSEQLEGVEHKDGDYL